MRVRAPLPVPETSSPESAKNGDFRAFLFVVGSEVKACDLAGYCSLVQRLRKYFGDGIISLRIATGRLYAGTYPPLTNYQDYSLLHGAAADPVLQLPFRGHPFAVTDGLRGLESDVMSIIEQLGGILAE